MNVEENRLRTFLEWPCNASVDAARIAKAGFYYSGRALEVQCFLCGVKISDWNYGDQAMARHRQAKPDCPFVLNPSSTCNVPLVPRANTVSEVLSSSSSSNSEGESLRAHNIGNQSAISSAIVQSRNPQTEYRTVSQRLRSFTKWPIPSIVSPERLAKSGFYYLQQADMVECAFCQGVAMEWEPNDDPYRVHRIHFPECDFYMHQDSDDDELELSNVKLMPGTTSDLAELGIQTHTAPRIPKHATYEGRLQTFQGWPKNMKQNPEMLANAGFYYFGTGDQVRCFHCDGGLRNWEATDDVWTEHARWFPKCGFVNLVRGQEFVKQCVDNRPPLDPSIFAGISKSEIEEVPETHSASISTVLPPVQEATEMLSPSLPTVLLPVQEVTETVLEGLLNTAPAMAALEIGLHVGRVKRALKKRMEEVGVPYTNADQLIQDVLHDQFMEDETRSDDRTLDSPSAELLNVLNEIITSQTLNNDSRSVDEPENSNTCAETKRANENTECVQQINTTHTKEHKGTKDMSKSDETVASLVEENRRLKEARLCKICMDKEVAVVFLPCGHLATCAHCAPSLMYCPMCRQEIRATVRTFLS